MEDELKKSVSTMDCINALFHCYGVSHQFDRLYKDGAFDDCARQRRELNLCVQLKFSTGAATTDILRQLLRNDASPTEGVVWQPQPPSTAATSPGGAGAAPSPPG